jgi:hypothetical protein
MCARDRNVWCVGLSALAGLLTLARPQRILLDVGYHGTRLLVEQFQALVRAASAYSPHAQSHAAPNETRRQSGESKRDVTPKGQGEEEAEEDEEEEADVGRSCISKTTPCRSSGRWSST